MAASPKRVLIIEDEKPLAHALELKLTHNGCAVTVARNGKAGVDLLRKHTYDVVLLDLMMPVLNGFQVLEDLKKKGHMPAVFVLSNLTQPEDEERVLDLGARKFWIKSDTPISVVVAEINKL